MRTAAASAARRRWRCRRPWCRRRPDAAPAAAPVAIDLCAVDRHAPRCPAARSVHGVGLQHDRRHAAGRRPGGPDARRSTQGDEVHDHPAQPAGRDHRRCWSRASRWSPTSTASPPVAPATYTFTAEPPGTYLYEAGPAAERPAPGRDGPVRRARRPPGRRGPGLRRRRRPRTTTRPCSCSARSTPRSTTRQPCDVRHAQVHAALLPDQREGLPGHRPDRAPRVAARCCCATSTPASSYHSMGVLGADQTVIALDGSPLHRRAPLRRGDVRPRPDRRRARDGAGRRPRSPELVDLRRQPAAAQQQRGRRRRHDDLDRRRRPRLRRRATPSDRSPVRRLRRRRRLTATVDDAAHGGSTSRRRVLPRRRGRRRHRDRDDRRRRSAPRPRTSPRRCPARLGPARPLRPRPGRRRQLGTAQLGARRRRRRRRPATKSPGADPAADQPRQHGGVAVIGDRGRHRLRRLEHRGRRVLRSTAAPQPVADDACDTAAAPDRQPRRHHPGRRPSTAWPRARRTSSRSAARTPQGNWGDAVTVNLVGRHDRPATTSGVSACAEAEQRHGAVQREHARRPGDRHHHVRSDRRRREQPDQAGRGRSSTPSGAQRLRHPADRERRRLQRRLRRAATPTSR